MEKWILFENIGEVTKKEQICKGCNIEDGNPTEIARFDTKEEMLKELSEYGAVVRKYSYVTTVYKVTEYYGELWELDEDGKRDCVGWDSEEYDLCYAELDTDASIEKDGWDY